MELVSNKSLKKAICGGKMKMSVELLGYNFPNWFLHGTFVMYLKIFNINGELLGIIMRKFQIHNVRRYIPWTENSIGIFRFFGDGVWGNHSEESEHLVKG
uniref:Uncharacterized protein n=1 Tax=Onchocerca volvulus TaxID=6282 RepID=A0A8R1Y038_ONCVO